MKKILIIDDDIPIGNMLEETLSSNISCKKYS